MATRFYLHNALSALSNLPTTKQSAHYATDDTVDAFTVNRVMDTTIGTAQVTKSNSSLAASAAWKDYYFTRFVSPALSGVSSITSNTWTQNFAASESSLAANWPVRDTDTADMCCYVWRPSTQARVGTFIRDNFSTATYAEGAAANTEYCYTINHPGAAITGVQDGDVICWEWWCETNQDSAGPFTQNLFYDGTTVTLTHGTVVSNHASFVETPQNLTFAGPSTITMTQSAAKTYSNKFITKV